MKKVILSAVSVALLAAMFILPVYARGGYVRTYNANSTQGFFDVEAQLAARKAYLDTLVDKGVITREQAEQELEYCREMIENYNVNGEFAGCGGYGMGGYGMGGCGRRGYF